MLSSPPSFAVREQFLEAFEAARGAGPAEIADFLPPLDHPQYRHVLREMIRIDLEIGWTRGTPTALADYLERFPALRDDPDGLAAVAYEEYRLRRQAGQTPDLQDYARHGVERQCWPGAPEQTGTPPPFSPTQCLEQAARLYRTHRGGGVNPAASNIFGSELFADLHRRDAAAADRLAEGLTSFPEAGQTFLDFRLLRELGRGAFGRVFLAEQKGLAGRRVALKIAADLVGESQTLAQLQHTHIVPIYSVHQAGPLQAVCMPYLGKTTIAGLLAELARHPAPPRSGLGLLCASQVLHHPATHLTPTQVIEPAAAPLSQTAAAAPAPTEIPEVARLGLSPVIRQRLEGCTYVEAVLWLGECLADGLAHAHERGILHRDLKPANVLLTDEGQPMLVDFNLAEDVKVRGTASGALIGGTLLYMSPEHLESFQGHCREIDARSDIYALGVILYQLLTRRYPFASGSTAGKKQTGSSLPELIEEMKVERRQSPPRLRDSNRDISPAVEAIIRKCLEPSPLRRYQTARALKDDLRRQLDGLPLLHADEPSLRERALKWWRRHPRLLGRAAIAGVMVLTLLAGFLTWRARDLARAEQAWSALDGFRRDMRSAHGLLTAQADDPAEREQGLVLAHQALARYPAPGDAEWPAHPAVAGLPESEQLRLKRDLGELLLLVARAETPAGRDRKQDLADARARLQKTLELNRLAEACFESDVPAALWWQRADILRQLGDRGESDRFRERAEQTPPQSADDFYLSARELAGQGGPHKAMPLLRQATRLDPRHFWAWFLLGRCLGDTGEDVKAVTCYSVCIALQPQSASAYFQRGLAHIQMKDYPQARADFDQTLVLQPEYVEAFLNRALVRQTQKDYAGAVDDLSAALKLGAAPTRVYFLRARARELAGDAAGAKQDFAEGLQRRPADEKSWIARGLARLGSAPEKALEDFDQALKLNPRSRAALRNKAHVLAEKLDRPRDSIAALDLVVQHYPDFATARSERGVMHARLGDRSKALADAQDALKRDGRPPLRYQVACIYALTSRTHAEDRGPALKLLRDALRQGYGSTLLAGDKDLDPLRSTPEFQRLAQAVAVLQGVAAKSGGTP
jgi:serine/threonine protein kinase/Tfp pilus assembly protein PilF